MKNWEIGWVAVGIALTTATQLRPSSPVGPGEAILFIWILIVGVRLLLFKSYSITPFAKIFFLFWLISFTSLMLGILIAESNNLTSEGVYHDWFSFLFSFVFCLCLEASIESSKSFKKLIAINVSFTTISLAILLLFHVPLLKPWYGGSRFAGWANNPNQTALLLSMIPLLSLHLLIYQKRPAKLIEKIIYFLIIIASVLIGRATDSDALKFGWFVGFSITILGLIYQRALGHKSINRITSLQKREIHKLIIKIILTLAILIVIYLVFSQVGAVANYLYNRGGHGSDRMILWKHGIAAIYSSPLFGLGPGAHSGVKEPFLDFESHNTFIDWASSSGIVGLSAYISLLGWVAWKAWRSGSAVLFASVISLAAFSSFHFVLRHTIFWFYLLSIANLSTKSLKDSTFLGSTTEPIKTILTREVRN